MSVEFEPFQKIARLNRLITVTEKLDGTNAAVVIAEMEPGEYVETVIKDFDESGNLRPGSRIVAAFTNDEADKGWIVYAQSRKRFIIPGDDNYGFAGWVQRNARELVAKLGPGRHFGEWWGAGIQRKYGLTGSDKRFSLFNTKRWAGWETELAEAAPGLGVVPTLYTGPFSQDKIDGAIQDLRQEGSWAAEGFMRPEGVVVYHRALNDYFKITLEGDEAPKGPAGHALDEEVR